MIYFPLPCTPPANNMEDYLSQFDSTLTELLDKHAPPKIISCSSRTRKPFITPEILKEKSKRSKLESIYRRTRSLTDHLNFKAQSRLVAKLVTAARRTYFKSKIANSMHQPKKLWATLNTLLSRSTLPTLPNMSNSSPSVLASAFLSHFTEKITKLSSSFTSSSASSAKYIPLIPPPPISTFSPASNDEVRAAILSSSNASCLLDTIPTFLLKSCIDVFIHPVTTLINFALTEGSFPSKYKHAVVYPKLKKHSLPQDDLPSYRPIFNLNFISKILERIIYNRINNHLQSFSSISPFQSPIEPFILLKLLCFVSLMIFSPPATSKRLLL